MANHLAGSSPSMQPAERNSTPKIQDYGVIGDGRSTALVSRHGSIDWLCWPRFDSPSLFASLLDHPSGGFWSIAPTRAGRIEQRYLDDTNVLETRFHTSTGTLVLTDFMPALFEEEKRTMLLPEHELIRRAECTVGECEIEIHFAPRPHFGRAKVVLRDRGPLGIRIDAKSGLINLQSTVRLKPAAEDHLSASVTLRKGERCDFSLTYATEGPAIVAPLGDTVSRKLELTAAWWRRWAAKAEYDGPWREQVVRSALAAIGIGTTASAGCAMRRSPPARSSAWDIAKRATRS
jgi:GH15 family glucan-1,4-alpha-glucosidase